MEKLRLIEVKGVKEWQEKNIEIIKKIQKVVKYLVHWKIFIVEHNIYKRKKDLENTKKIVAKYEKRMSIEVRRQEKLEMEEEQDFRRGELVTSCSSHLSHNHG